MTQNNEFIGVLTTDTISTGWRFDHGNVTQIALGATIETVLAQLQSITPKPVYIASSYESATQSVPANILPQPSPNSAHLRLHALHQTSPADIIAAPARLRIAGFLAQNENWDGVILLLDDVLSQWVLVSANEVVSFQSFLTGKLASVLDVSNNTAACPNAIDETMSRPERLASHLRSAEIAQDPRAILGHLIGAEISAAKPYWLGQKVAIINDQKTPENWGETLRAQNVPLQFESAQPMLLAGFESWNAT